MILKQISIIVLSVLAGIFSAYMLNFMLDVFLIPDPCYYHDHDTNIIFDVFYDLPSSEGYHPYPTTFNNIFTLVIGAVSGSIFSIYKLKKDSSARSTQTPQRAE